MDHFTPVLILIMLVMVIASIAWQSSRGTTLLERWVRRNQLKLISSEVRWLVRGPFWWRTSKGQCVYRVEVIDASGEYRSGFVRLGGWFLGLWSDEAMVEWDRPRSTNGPPGFPVIVDDDAQRDKNAD